MSCATLTVMRSPVRADSYTCFEDLAREHVEGVDFQVHVREPLGSRFAVLAPHGGRIEGGTSQIARLVAGEDHGLYLFEGLRENGDNFDRLHLTSRNFDEPRCLSMIAGCDVALVVHGYFGEGPPDVLLGGLHRELRDDFAVALRAAGLSVATEGHKYPGLDPRNICNRARSGRGVQMELSTALRRSRQWETMVEAARGILASYNRGVAQG